MVGARVRLGARACSPRPGGYVLYYTTLQHEHPARSASRTRSARTPSGPFVDSTTAPLICPAGGGAIDPNPFVAANGAVYLLWKNYDGSDRDHGASSSRPTGSRLVGPAAAAHAVADQAWEAGHRRGADDARGADGSYYLFYSGNDWNTAELRDQLRGVLLTSRSVHEAEPDALADVDLDRAGAGEPVGVHRSGRQHLARAALVGPRSGRIPARARRNLFVVRFAIVDGKPALT